MTFISATTPLAVAPIYVYDNNNRSRFVRRSRPARFRKSDGKKNANERVVVTLFRLLRKYNERYNRPANVTIAAGGYNLKTAPRSTSLSVPYVLRAFSVPTFARETRRIILLNRRLRTICARSLSTKYSYVSLERTRRSA